MAAQEAELGARRVMSIADAAPLPAGFPADAPEIAVEKVPNCPTCGATQRTHFAYGHDYELETCRNEWHFWQCDRCGTVWLDPRPAVSALPIIYPQHYYAYSMSDTFWPLALKGKEILDHFKFNMILGNSRSTPKSFLDVGCGDGRYLKMFAKRGISKERIYGLELSQDPVRRLREQGFQAYQQRVEECTQIPEGTIDLATMFHVIEHVADPRDVVCRVADWLSPGGVFAVETPNIASWDARLFKERWWGGYHIPRHWTLFHADSLQRLLKEAGLEVLHVAYQTGHSFWMYSFHHILKYNSRSPRPRLARLFDPLKDVPMLIAFTGFDILRRFGGARTSAVLMIARKPTHANLNTQL
jgi:2-polyprenyl-3-methyl-5-hydroxy-6-metoxy-1,4-benzoquinol methylase